MIGEIIKKSFINIMIFVVTASVLIFIIALLLTYGKDWAKQKIAQYIADVLPF